MSTVLTVTQNLTGSAPTLATQGASLINGAGLRLGVSAPSGQTLSGAGSIAIYLYNPSLAAWVRNPDLDLAITAAHAGVRRVTFPDQPIAVPLGRVLGVPVGVTVSGGTTVDVTHEVFSAPGK